MINKVVLCLLYPSFYVLTNQVEDMAGHSKILAVSFDLFVIIGLMLIEVNDYSVYVLYDKSVKIQHC